MTRVRIRTLMLVVLASASLLALGRHVVRPVVTHQFPPGVLKIPPMMRTPWAR